MDTDVRQLKQPAESGSELSDQNEQLSDSQDKNTLPETFQTPEEVAADDTLVPQEATELAVTTELEHNPSTQTPTAAHQGRRKFTWPPTKKQAFIIALVAVLILGVGSAAALLHHSPKKISAAEAPKASAPRKTVAALPTTVPATLTGLPVAASINTMPVTGVMIENTTDARPQSGLSQAGVVFEAVAEGGVTRFLALFQDQTPTNVGPIRSARPYYVQWDLGFDAAYAHVGGSQDALSDITSWHVQDLNEFYNGSSYHRITSREAPHNVYTGIDTLNKLEASKGFTSSYSGFVRKLAAPSEAPTARKITMNLSGAVYNPAYVYNATSNSYDRSEGGAAQIDANTNTQLSPKVVIAIVVPESQGALDSSGAYYSDYDVLGSGVTEIFQDGIETTGQWNKPTNTSQITFTDSTGKAIGLDPGQTWITAVTSTKNVSYTP
jgi:hypothetical protein